MCFNNNTSDINCKFKSLFMENSFKKIEEPHKETPVGLKKGVVKNITTFKLFTEFFELFFNNFGKVAESVFKKR